MSLEGINSSCNGQPKNVLRGPSAPWFRLARSPREPGDICVSTRRVAHASHRQLNQLWEFQPNVGTLMVHSHGSHKPIGYPPLFYFFQSPESGIILSSDSLANMILSASFILLVTFSFILIINAGFVPPAELCLPTAHLKKLEGCIAMTDKEDECAAKESDDEKLKCYCTQETLDSIFA